MLSYRFDTANGDTDRTSPAYNVHACVCVCVGESAVDKYYLYYVNDIIFVLFPKIF